MRRSLPLAAALLLSAAPLFAQAAPDSTAPAGPISDAQAQAAIDYGKAHPNTNYGLGIGRQVPRCHGSHNYLSECGYTIVLKGPFGIIATAAATRAGQYLPFTLDSVSAEMRAPVLTVFVTPQAPDFADGSWHQAQPVQRVVLQAKGPSRDVPGAVVQPLALTPVPMQWTNALGATFSSQGAVATFDRSQVPPGDFDVVLVTGGREVRSTLSARDYLRSADWLK
jgi:hypothetical protein